MTGTPATTGPSGSPRVRTAAGVVRGRDEGGVLAFLGVPYAAPITSRTRWLAPQPAGWSGERDATRPSGVCPQVPTYGPVGTGATSALAADEDFLTVNVRTPSLTGSAPVLVWVHGGGYAVGSANEPVLRSGAFARSGVVEVTVNYRLGALGFLHLPGAPDNRGLLDVVAALQWVRREIAGFGGDPERVTLAGRSAGGFAVATLLAMPAARGLFHRAFAQSGAATAVVGPEDAARVTERMARRVTEADDGGADRSDGLAGAPLEALLLAQKEVCDESYERHDHARDGAVTMVGIPFQPVIDGVSLPRHPLAAAAAGEAAPVPLVVGCTTAEYLTHATAWPPFDTGTAARSLDPRVRPAGLTGVEILDRYRDRLPDHSGTGLWRAVAGDLVFQNPATRLAHAHAEHQPVLKYLVGEVEPDELGSRHGAEVAAVWDAGAAGVGGSVHELWADVVRLELDTLTERYDWDQVTRDATPVLRVRTSGPDGAEADPFADRVGLWEPEHTRSAIAG